MPLLTVTSTSTGDLVLQDPTGWYVFSHTLAPSAVLSSLPISTDLFARIEPQLIALHTAGKLNYSIADDPASAADDFNAGTVTITNGAVTTSKLAANAVTGPKLSSSAFKSAVFTGHNGTGAVTLTGTKVGDKVLMLVDLTDSTDGSASFEATITVNDQIQQTSASNLSAKTFTILWLVQS